MPAAGLPLFQGEAANLNPWKELVRVRAEVEEILSRHTGHPVTKIRTDTDRNKTFSAPEAVDYGLADEVITSRPQAPAELARA